MRVVIIGGSGHVGTYLVPMLVERGYEVINITRGQKQPYLPHAAWQKVRQIEADREQEDRDNIFGERILELHPDVVIDMICFTETSARQIVKALRGQVRHFLHCGTVWIYGHSTEVPATENQPRHPFGEYGIQKAAIEAYLLEEARQNRFPATMLHPGHIVGPGYAPLNPAGHFNPEVFARLARGEELALPNLGLETVHHVHASDVAQAFLKAMDHWSTSVGENFHVVSPAALTLRGYAEAISAWFGREAKLSFLPWQTWRETVTPEEANATWDHIAHSPNASICKAERLLGYQPRYTSLQAVYESVQWLIDYEKIKI
ncbi:MAG TPA: NAD-dependent epimerase/dehydratase family protein [Phototrophicaceae bacterium]|jgi:nucleoside-diphosphate-sugar epimerase|nr:NAD-dependent epimerase/dehydratase family protein [Phototrophicaceae bacterium]